MPNGKKGYKAYTCVYPLHPLTLVFDKKCTLADITVAFITKWKLRVMSFFISSGLGKKLLFLTVRDRVKNE
jgi:hypothetical protein